MTDPRIPDLFLDVLISQIVNMKKALAAFYDVSRVEIDERTAISE